MWNNINKKAFIKAILTLFAIILGIAGIIALLVINPIVFGTILIVFALATLGYVLYIFFDNNF